MRVKQATALFCCFLQVLFYLIAIISYHNDGSWFPAGSLCASGRLMLWRWGRRGWYPSWASASSWRRWKQWRKVRVFPHGLKCPAIFCQVNNKSYSWFSCKCGLNTVRMGTKVVGGQNANKGEVGWQVGLARSSSTSSASIFCGGTLLNARWVLGAAHCGTRWVTIWSEMYLWSQSGSSTLQFQYCICLDWHDRQTQSQPGWSCHQNFSVNLPIKI